MSEQQFLSEVMAELEQEECILWTGAKAGKGYGVTSRNGKQAYVHRLAWEEVNGPIPAGMVVAHKCDTPACHNPAHLFVCTQRENMADMRAKGRSAKGDKHHSKKKPESIVRGERIGTAKLKPEQIAEIRATYKPGRAGRASDNSLTGLARRYGVAFQTISKIVNRKSWSHA
jgi:hypothetical protein